MHVLPAYQRRGLGQRLMEEAILDADKDGSKAYLSASDAGKRLYVKYRFKDLEVKYIDFTHLGAIGAPNTTAMMREPQSVRV
jgi:ribosomal protein S18 acetylase RimI-like enzyme